MKKIFCILLLSFFASYFAVSQIVTTHPAVVTRNYNDTIFVIFDASQGSQGLMNYSGTVYAHTGVITNQSANDSDWKHAPLAWATPAVNIPKYTCTSLGNNLYRLAIAPNMTEYYGLTAGEIVQKLAFVFRNADGTKTGKTATGGDIFVDVVDASLHVAFEQPSQKNLLIAKDTELQIKINALLQSDITLFINGNNVISSVT
ncbi:MAG: Por secretion system protein, partial [Bacteroidales bacterium]|nr:Por secretion system protein [Bacteroidales bacterium]